MAFMSDKRKELLAGAMLEMLEHSNHTAKTHAVAVLESAVKRDLQAGGTPVSTKEMVLGMARILELAEEHKERVLAHDLAGCD